VRSPPEFDLFGRSMIYELIEVTNFEDLAYILIGYEITLCNMLVSISNQV
jgi:hypothetical protein